MDFSPLRRTTLIIALILALGLGFSWRLYTVRSASPLDRDVTQTVQQTVYIWWLVPWGGNEPVCEITSLSSTLPSHDEIYVYCGKARYEEWATAPPCFDPTGASCSGYYLQYVRSERREVEVTITYPLPQFTLRLEGCEAAPDTNVCPEHATLQIQAQEPIPGEQILLIRGTLGRQGFICEGDTCTLDFTPTTGTLDMTYWAESSFGDRSPQYVARLQVSPIEPGVWRVDVLGEHWVDVGQAACAQTWESFPPPEGLPDWLTSPTSANSLATDEPFTLLAGYLIRHGLASAASCADGGLLPNGAASPCGLEATREAVTAWQNRFDADILSAAYTYHVPARVLKRIFAQESQFWPGALGVEEEYGLGQLTDFGADMLLLWSPTYYNQLCPTVLGEATCRKPYSMLSETQQAMLRGAVLAALNLNCPTCEQGLDLRRVPQAIHTTAAMLSASCAQTGQVIRETLKVSPGRIASYPDLWRMTLANYNAGPGCLADALQKTHTEVSTITWENVKANLPPSCQSALTYVDNVARWSTEGQNIGAVTPVPTPTATPTAPYPAPGEPGPYPPPTSP